MNVVVPIQTEALRVTNATNQQAFTALYDFSVLGNHPLSSQNGLIAAQNFRNRFTALAAGIHLHWSVPKAYTKGIQDNKTGDLVFPVVPNRWLLTRFYRDNASGKTSTSTWIIESDIYGAALTNQAVSVPTVKIPIMDANTGIYGLSSSSMGRTTLLSGAQRPIWTEGVTAGLNAVQQDFQALFAYGETFTAYYRNNGGSLGFYDTLADIGVDLNRTSFSVSYSVVGWVNDVGQDALNRMLNTYDATKNSDFNGFVKSIFETELHWKLNDYSPITATNYQSAQGVLAGTVAGIGWNTLTGNSYPSPLPDSSQLTIAVGRNTAEALSSYINGVSAGTINNIPSDVNSNLEWVLNAFQYGQLQRVAAGDVGIGQLDEYLHSRSFTSTTGGYVWAVRSPGKPNDPNETPTNVEATLPLPLAQLLSRLNQSQTVLDACRDEIESRQKKLFFDWSYHVEMLYENVFKPGTLDNIANDHTAPYLLNGLLDLFPIYQKTGNYSPSNRPLSFPMSYTPEPFSIIAPTDTIQNLGAIPFNAKANSVAEAAVSQLINWQYNLEPVIPDGVSNIQAALNLTNTLLPNYNTQAQDASTYQDQILTLLRGAQQVAIRLNGSLVQINDSGAINGLTQLKQQVDQALETLLTFGDPSSGALTKWFPIDGGGLDNSPYVGKIKDRAHFLYAQSWVAKNDFPGMGALIDQIGGHNANPQNLFDIELAAIYLGIAYLWANSGVAGNQFASPYAIELAQQVIADAIANARTVSAALQTAISLYTSLNGTVGQAIASLASTASNGMLQVIINAVNNQDPVTALAATRAALNPQTTTPLLGLPALAKAVTGTDWLALIAQIETCWLTIANRLPQAHQISILGSFVYGKVQEDYDLQQTPNDEFWQPNEPVILLGEGKAQDQILRPVNRNGRADLIPCRLESELAQFASASYPPPFDNFAALLDPKIAGLAVTIQTIMREAYLFIPEFAKATVAVQSLFRSAVYLDAQQEALFANVPYLPASGDPQSPLPFTGLLPYFIAYNFWQPTSGTVDQNPLYTDIFLPLFIYWQAEYLYSNSYDNLKEQYSADHIAALFVEDQYSTDYQPKTLDSFKKNSAKQNYNTIGGVISLSSSATANLQEQIRVFCVQVLNYDPKSGQPDPKDTNYDQKYALYQAYSAFDQWNVLSQAMSGFNAALLQRVQELQIPLNIPANWAQQVDKTNFWITEFLNNQTANWNYTWMQEGLNLNALQSGDQKAFFTPLRAGFLQLIDLHLVDVFGRNISVPKSNPTYVAGNMHTANEQYPDADHQVYLAPRFIQPSRLNFKWLSAESPDGLGPFIEWNSHPAASPICGWLFPNHLDNSLMVYDSAGTPQGSAGRQDVKVHWFPVPGSAVKPFSAIANPVLRNFLTNFVQPDSDFESFQRFLHVLDLAQQFIITPGMQQEQNLAVFIGQPMVIAEAIIQFELEGIPDTSLDDNVNASTFNKWDGSNTSAFQLNDKGYLPYDFTNFNSANITQVRVPVLLGDPEVVKPNADPVPFYDDGLIGYFIEGDPTFYTPVQLPTNFDSRMKSTYGLSPQELPIQLTPNAPAIKLTLLLDPRAVVRATTNVLPVTSIEVPPEQYQTALDRLMAYFLIAPYLSLQSSIPSDFQISVPDEVGYRWFWYQVGGADQPIQPLQANMDATFPPNGVNYIIDGWLKLKKKL